MVLPKRHLYGFFYYFWKDYGRLITGFSTIILGALYFSCFARAARICGFLQHIMTCVMRVNFKIKVNDAFTNPIILH